MKAASGLMPTPGRIALDTSGAVAILRGVPAARATVTGLSFLGLPAIALGESRYEAERALQSALEFGTLATLSGSAQ